MLTVAQFYADSHFRRGYGWYGPRPQKWHSGQDIGGWQAGTTIPSWCVGKVVESEWDSGYGWKVIVHTAFGFVMFAHMHQKGAAVGSTLAVGSTVGAVGDTGSLSAGNHLHTSLSAQQSMTVTVNPAERIRSARGGTAGGGVTPLPGDESAPTPVPPPPFVKRKERLMIAVRIGDGAGKLGAKGKTRTYIVGGCFFLDTTEHATANLASVVVQGFDPDGNILDVPNLTYRELYDYAKASRALTTAQLKPYADAAGI